MGRSYSFEPFRSQQPAQVFKGSGAKLGNDESKVTLSKDEEQATTTQLPSAPVHYGHNHAETVTRYQKKAQARKRAAKAPAAQAKPAAAKKATAKPAATTPARKQAASATTPRMTTGTAKTKTEKTPSRKTVAAAPEAVRSLGRKVLTRAATAAKKGVASVVKKATKVATKATTTARKATKKR